MARVTLDEMLASESCADLCALYRERGAEGADEKVLQQAQDDFYELAIAAAREVEAPPERFVPEVVERDGRRYEIFGVIHGYIGGQDADYKGFVSAPIAEFPFVIFENGLNYMYRHKSGVVIPDFMVLGVLGSLRLGFQVGIEFPIHIWEILLELLKPKRERSAEEGFLYDRRFYAIDVEVRRGVEPSPPLPSRLQIDYEMSRRDAGGMFAKFGDPYAIVPRSLFMAGFAVGCAESRELTSVPLVVGDLHTAEIQRFLEDPKWAEHPLFIQARDFARKRGAARLFSFWGEKVLHLSLSGLTGALILVPVLALLAWLLVLAGLI